MFSPLVEHPPRIDTRNGIFSLIRFLDDCRYRITPERYSKRPDVADVDDADYNVSSPAFRPLSSQATDLRMGVASFCKAFPWHFVVDRQLELVQLGVGFMRIFGHHLNRHGREISTYFVFTRPHGVTLTFHEILKRANTPFVLSLQRPQGVDKYPAEVTHVETMRTRRSCRSLRIKANSRSSLVEGTSSVGDHPSRLHELSVSCVDNGSIR